MHLIIIHGLPGVGKLTVAKELAKKTGYKLFHNHITIDAISSLFDRSHSNFLRLNRELRLKLLEEAARQNLAGVIVTYSYAHPTGDLFIKPLLALADTYAIILDFVYLSCSPEELYKRIESPSRRGTTKLHTKKEFLEAQKKFNFTKIPSVDSYTIDTTTRSPETVAQMILNNYLLDQ